MEKSDEGVGCDWWTVYQVNTGECFELRVKYSGNGAVLLEGVTFIR